MSFLPLKTKGAF